MDVMDVYDGKVEIKGKRGMWLWERQSDHKALL